MKSTFIISFLAILFFIGCNSSLHRTKELPPLTVKIKVLNQKGVPLSGLRVHSLYPTSSGTVSKTDSNGIATFLYTFGPNRSCFYISDWKKMLSIVNFDVPNDKKLYELTIETGYDYKFDVNGKSLEKTPRTKSKQEQK